MSILNGLEDRIVLTMIGNDLTNMLDRKWLFASIDQTSLPLGTEPSGLKGLPLSGLCIKLLLRHGWRFLRGINKTTSATEMTPEETT